MAYRIPNKSPLDIQNRKIIGYKFPLNAGAVFHPTYTTKDQIKYNLINYILTNKGERIFNPFFGADLRKKIFDPLTLESADLLKKQLENDIKTLFPRVKLNEVKINNIYDINTLNVIINYSVPDFGIEDNINIEIS